MASHGLSGLDYRRIARFYFQGRWKVAVGVPRLRYSEVYAVIVLCSFMSCDIFGLVRVNWLRATAPLIPCESGGLDANWFCEEVWALLP